MRSCLNNLRDTPEPGQDLFTRLRQAVTDIVITLKRLEGVDVYEDDVDLSPIPLGFGR